MISLLYYAFPSTTQNKFLEIVGLGECKGLQKHATQSTSLSAFHGQTGSFSSSGVGR